MSSRSDEPVRAVVQYSGNVQGVGFRATAQRQAVGAEVHGWVRNEPDGSVRIEAEGVRGEVESFLQRVRAALGPHIEDEQIEWEPPTGARGGFTVRH